MPITVLGGTKVADTAYEIANSCRWNDGDSMKMTRTPSGDGNLDVWTYSTWIKLGNIGVEYVVFHTYGASGTTETFVKILSGGAIEFSLRVSGTYEGQLITNRLFRDPSAWYHLCFVMNTGNATSGDRMILYVNGVRETSFSTETYPDQNQDSTINDASFEHTIGSYGSGNYFDGYMAEVVFLDGTAAAITDLGEFDEDSPTIWKPKDPSGLTFGTNGFYLDFEDSANLGNDANGGADWTEVNFAAIDSSTDTPTNNFCVMNPLVNTTDAAAVFSQGNTVVVTDGSSGDWGFAGTIAMSNGKWYMEHRIHEDKQFLVGIHSAPDILAAGSLESVGTKWCYAYRGSGRLTTYNDAGSKTDTDSWGSTFTTGDIIGVYLDLDNNKLYFAKNDTLQNSGTGITITDPSLTQHGAYWWCQTDANSGESWTITPAFGGLAAWNTTAMSSVVNDKNGWGSFEYDPSRGGSSDFDSAAKDFYSLCTKNLAEFGG
jgi:hypothetical protein